MKSITYFNPNRIDEYDNVFDALDNLSNRAILATDVLDLLRKKGVMSGTDLDKEVTKRYGEEKYSIRPLLETMASNGRNIRIEVREEESIMVKMNKPLWGKVIKTHDDSFIIFVPKYSYDQTPFLIYNPVVGDEGDNIVSGMVSYVKGKRMVQVRRKYYHWVG